MMNMPCMSLVAILVAPQAEAKDEMQHVVKVSDFNNTSLKKMERKL